MLTQRFSNPAAGRAAATPTVGRAGAAPSDPVAAPRRRSGNGPPVRRWVVPAAGLGLVSLLAIPTLTVLLSLIQPVDGRWAELMRLTLPDYLATTFWLALGVCLGTGVVGTATAWLVTMCRFPSSRLCELLLLLPMAVPAYLLAYTYADLFQFSGPVQSALRAWFGWGRGDYWFPPIRSLGGAIVVMTFVLYPYAYLLARAAFLEQSVCVLEASRSLGQGPWRAFLRVALPLARPAIVAGIALAGMEALADYGTVKHFEVNTLTAGIYQSWFQLGSPIGAAKLAAGLLLVVLLVLAAERRARGGRRYHHTTGRYRPPTPYRLRGGKAAAALVACLAPPLIGFALPAGALLWLALRGGDPTFGPAFLGLVGHSFGLALLAAAVTVLVAGAIGYGVRLAPSRPMRLASRLATTGYAVPGAVIAVGVLIPFGRFDNAIDAWARATFGVSTGLILSGTLVALLFAYLVRFLAVAGNAVDSGLSRIRPSMEEAARNLGRGPLATALRVHAPLMKGSILTAALLVFVEALKELPATLILRPFNFDTLAVRAYQLASDERLAEASTAALTIVVVGLLPVTLLIVGIAKSRR